MRGDLRGRTIEMHVGSAYTEPLRLPLVAQGASLATPLAHLRQGEQLAWYNARLTPGSAAPKASGPSKLPDTAAGLARLLSEQQQALSPTDLLARGPNGLQVPGLYSWWVDETGAADLSRGLGQHVAAG